MTFRHTLQTALAGLRMNKSRSALTILGIVIGITAIMLVMSLGAGAQALILAQIEGLGPRTIVVIPGREPTGSNDAAQIFSDSLKARDLELIRRRENVPLAEGVVPVVFGGESAAYGSETYRLTIFGASPQIAGVFDLPVAEGTWFTDEDVRSRADVVVIGSKVEDELFGEASGLGQRIKIKGRAFRVIGVLPAKGQVSFFNFDETAVVPYTTAQQYVFGIKHFHRFIVTAQTDADITPTVRDLQLTLRDSHGISDPDKDDFFVQTQVDLAARFGAVTGVLTLFLTSMAAISLLVGGVGIMNIMLVAVTERTREIGLRKALGATDGNILTQFLLEAVALTATGGLIGIALGSFLAWLAAYVLSRFAALGWIYTFPWSAAAMGLGMSAAIGLVFGLYPARQAARKSPIEALRYE